MSTPTNSSNSSDFDNLDAQTAGLRLDDDGVVIEGLDSLEDMQGVQINQPSISSSVIVDSLWDEPLPEVEEKALLCNVHGLVCSKGICSVYSAQLKEAERQKKGPPGKWKGKGKGGMQFNRGAGKLVYTSMKSRPFYLGVGGAGAGGHGRPTTRKDGWGNGNGKPNGGRKMHTADGSETTGGFKDNKGSDAGSSEGEAEEQANSKSAAWETASAGPW
jgi:hypothetical protein